jgi:hypothetical protein
VSYRLSRQAPAYDDGVEYRADTVSSRIIRDEALYSGVRIAMDCAIATAVVKFRLDVNFGDPVTPAPRHLSLPSLRPGLPPVRVLGYPIETVLAEKITTAIGLGPANTRVRDYADIYTLTRNWPVDHGIAREALLPPPHSVAPRSRRSPARLITSLTSASRPTRPTGQISALRARICQQTSTRW